ncbi:uncharacterized protein L969DRAFT_73939 [Mixia osmundae IAM 14324]|uniref:Protein LOT5 n=1 Tax=Mixia osmundae (strain CBS 9802 / IAM 14324 / JCM 22182 / KY 12970) TaxID=764103 RepID=G7EA16_MIXOS|nr:uncharacterized protein L969DRAFT_73939 [Mixia osmundae IAM 14324]KEI40363.1 hypothetical protein L969DRAFT_73939 [Mixia osmundae IAM 14324]GAA99676.1 hypothetical protein E5Q_06379 [Mixia osmundae IAM 14324]
MPIESIASLGTSITAEEYADLTRTTPSDFASLPPVRHWQGQALICFVPSLPSFASAGWSQGVLSVTEHALLFLSESSTGVRLTYPVISLHAISPKCTIPLPDSAQESERPCIYCQIDESEGRDEEEEDSEQRELYILPQDASQTEAIFAALSQCASLHPAPSEQQTPSLPFHLDNDAHLNGDRPEWSGPIQDDAELTQAGRTQMNRLEALVDWSSLNGDAHHVERDNPDAVEDAPER